MLNCDDIELIDEPSADTIDCVQQGATLTSPDDSLGLPAHVPIFGRQALPRGQKSFGKKRDTQYLCDSGEPTPVAFLNNVVGPRTVLFTSIYSDVDTIERCVAENVVHARHERLVKHPVSVGCIKRAGLPIVPAKATQWSLYWGARWQDHQYQQLSDRGQCKVNHFPLTYLLGRKDNLSRSLRRAITKHGSLFAVHPRTYLLPADALRVEAEFKRNPEGVWIYKPAALSRGRGIQVFRAASGVPDAKASAEYVDDGEDNSGNTDEVSVVQQYVPNPLLINGFKVDFRIYCVVTSFDPLLIYVYNEGLVRFATAPYGSDLSDQYSHLTNFSVNKQNTAFVRPGEDCDSNSSKWSLHMCREHFGSVGLSWDAAWRNIVRTVTAGIVSVADDVATSMLSTTRRRFSCFELFGVDVLLDEHLNAHLIEYNVLPSLGCGSALDKHIKGFLVADVLTLCGVPIDDDTWNGRAIATKFNGSFEALSQEDRQIIAEAENQLSRCGGFTRVFPGPATSDFQLYPSKTTSLLCAWETQKSKWNDAERATAIEWLKGSGPFPSIRPATAAEIKKASTSAVVKRKSTPRPSTTAKHPTPPAQQPELHAAHTRRASLVRPPRKPTSRVSTAVLPQQLFTFVDV
jgi:tubulin polyglutamylase TTLL4